MYDRQRSHYTYRYNPFVTVWNGIYQQKASTDHSYQWLYNRVLEGSGTPVAASCRGSYTCQHPSEEAFSRRISAAIATAY